MHLIYVLILMLFFILGNRGGYIHEISAQCRVVDNDAMTILKEKWLPHMARVENKND